MTDLIFAVLGAYLGLGLIWYIVLAVASFRIFKKAGEPGWKGLIPVYNTYVQYRFSWETRYFWYMILTMAVGGILSSLGDGEGAINTVGDVVSFVGWAIWVIGEYRLSRSFGHGIPFTVGLVLLGPVFRMILGFGKSRYLGNPD